MQGNLIYISRDKGPRSLDQTQLPLDQLQLDSNNVRFRHLGQMVNDQNAEEILWKDADTKTLFQEILVAGGLSEPIYARRQENGVYMVKEGNRRVVCLRRAASLAAEGSLNGFKPADFSMVPAFVLDDQVTPEEEAILEARWHVMGAGKKQWPAFNQSAHIWAMHHRLGMPVATISEALGMSKPTIYKRLRSYSAMVEYQAQTGDKDIRRFSFFDEAYKSRDVTKWLSEDPDHLHNLIDWIKEGKFDRTGARDLREFKPILDDPGAKAIFAKKGFDAAYLALRTSKPEVTSETFMIVKQATEVLQAIPLYELEATGSDQHRQTLLLSLRNEIDTILKKADVK